MGCKVQLRARERGRGRYFIHIIVLVLGCHPIMPPYKLQSERIFSDKATVITLLTGKQAFPPARRYPPAIEFL